MARRREKVRPRCVGGGKAGKQSATSIMNSAPCVRGRAIRSTRAAARAHPQLGGGRGRGALAKEKRPELYRSGRWTTKH